MLGPIVWQKPAEALSTSRKPARGSGKSGSAAPRSYRSRTSNRPQVKTRNKRYQRRHYQETTRDKVLQQTKSHPEFKGFLPSLIIAPPSAGKTAMFSKAVLESQGIENFLEEDVSLVIAHRDFLLNQAIQTFYDLCPSQKRQELLSKIELIQGAQSLRRINPQDNSKIFFISTDTLKNNPSLVSRLPLDKVKNIVLDEAHHYVAQGNYGMMEKLFKEIRNSGNSADVRLIGATATEERHTPSVEGKYDLSELFPADSRVWSTTWTELLKLGFIKKPIATKIKLPFDISQLKTNSKTKDFTAKSVAHLVRTEGFRNLLVDIYKNECLEKNKENTIVYCADKDTTIDQAKSFAEQGYKSAYVLDGKSCIVEKIDGVVQEREISRDDALANFGKSGKDGFKVLLNCDVLTEGTDLPQTQSIIYAGCTKSVPKFKQIIGRALRINDNKPDELDANFLYLNLSGSREVGYWRDLEKVETASMRDIGFKDSREIRISLDRDDFQYDFIRDDQLDLKDLILSSKAFARSDDEETWLNILDRALRQRYPDLKEANIAELINASASEFSASLGQKEADLRPIIQGDLQYIKSDLDSRQALFSQYCEFVGIDLDLHKNELAKYAGYSDFNYLSIVLKESIKDLIDSLISAPDFSHAGDHAQVRRNALKTAKIDDKKVKPYLEKFLRDNFVSYPSFFRLLADHNLEQYFMPLTATIFKINKETSYLEDVFSDIDLSHDRQEINKLVKTYFSSKLLATKIQELIGSSGEQVEATQIALELMMKGDAAITNAVNCLGSEKVTELINQILSHQDLNLKAVLLESKFANFVDFDQPDASFGSSIFSAYQKDFMRTKFTSICDKLFTQKPGLDYYKKLWSLREADASLMLQILRVLGEDQFKAIVS